MLPHESGSVLENGLKSPSSTVRLSVTVAVGIVDVVVVARVVVGDTVVVVDPVTVTRVDDVVVVAELPHTATAKVQKLALRGQWANHLVQAAQ